MFWLQSNKFWKKWKMLIYVTGLPSVRWGPKWGRHEGCFTRGLQQWMIRYMNIVLDIVLSLGYIYYPRRFGWYFYFILSIMKSICVMANGLLEKRKRSQFPNRRLYQLYLTQEEMSNTMRYTEKVGSMTWNFSRIKSEWKEKNSRLECRFNCTSLSTISHRLPWHWNQTSVRDVIFCSLRAECCQVQHGDRGCFNLLAGQAYHTHHMTVAEWWLARRGQLHRGKSCHSIIISSVHLTCVALMLYLHLLCI